MVTAIFKNKNENTENSKEERKEEKKVLVTVKDDSITETFEITQEQYKKIAVLLITPESMLKKQQKEERKENEDSGLKAFEINENEEDVFVVEEEEEEVNQTNAKEEKVSQMSAKTEKKTEETEKAKPKEEKSKKENKDDSKVQLDGTVFLKKIEKKQTPQGREVWIVNGTALIKNSNKKRDVSFRIYQTKNIANIFEKLGVNTLKTEIDSTGLFFSFPTFKIAKFKTNEGKEGKVWVLDKTTVGMKENSERYKFNVSFKTNKDNNESNEEKPKFKKFKNGQ